MSNGSSSFGVDEPWYSIPGPQAYIEWTPVGGTPQQLSFDLVESENWEEGAEITEHPVEVGANIADHVRIKLAKCTLKIFSTNEPIDGNVYENAQQTKSTLAISTPAWNPGSGVVIVPQWSNHIELRALAGVLVGLAGGYSGRGGEIAGVATVAIADLLLPGTKSSLPVPTNAGLVPQAPAGATATVQTFSGTDFVEAVHFTLLTLKNSAQIFQVIGTKQYNLSMVIESLSFMRDVDTGTGESLTIGFKEIRQVATQTTTVPTPNLSAGGGVPPVSHGGQAPVPVPPFKTQSGLYVLKHMNDPQPGGG